MALTYLRNNLTEEEYLKQRYKQSERTGRYTKSALNNLKHFCRDQFDRELVVVLADLRKDVLENNQLDTVMVFLQKFITWLSEPHPHIMMKADATKRAVQFVPKDLTSIEGYLGQTRLYMKKVGGIPIHSEDISDYKFSFPPPSEKEDPEPLLLSEFKLICDNQPNFKRHMLYRAMKSFESRIGATVQLRKKHFNITVRPIAVSFPAHIMKKKNGKSYGNKKYVITEDEEDLLKLLEGLSDDDLVYGTNEEVEVAINNEHKAWMRLVHRPEVNLVEIYRHSGHLKKNIHSIKSMTFTAAEEAVNETYAHAYGDHSRYTKTYLRWTEEKKITKFRLLEPLISIYTKFEQNESKISKENILLKSQLTAQDSKINTMAKQLQNIADETKDKTKIKLSPDKLAKVIEFIEQNKI